MRDAPNHNAAEFDLLVRLAVGSAPGIPNHHPVAFRDTILYRYVNIRKTLERGGKIHLGSGRPRGRVRRGIGSVLLVLGTEVPVGSREILLVDEVFKMLLDKSLHFFNGHFLQSIA